MDVTCRIVWYRGTPVRRAELRVRGTAKYILRTPVISVVSAGEYRITMPPAGNLFYAGQGPRRGEACADLTETWICRHWLLPRLMAIRNYRQMRLAVHIRRA